ncbi:DUF4974 domain-containing protein [Arenibacter aquaticus]|uniref:DUF4974 domain-containing protein n=1 Tax=Arenibacter aquaticus TaxID=2489054 RepID=A0A3S0CNH1_9FLAO|nr:FecR domain-containing protein [Arenibacter aquaticus]RTE55407.1 DUF4974 domain-containing protein [Arenibacter aquaticus]
MNSKNLTYRLFQKLADNTISKEEFDKLMELIKVRETNNISDAAWAAQWKKIKSSKYFIRERHDLDSKVLFQKILNKIEPLENLQKAKKKKILAPKVYWTGIAACFLIIAGIFTFYKKNTVPQPGLTNPIEQHLDANAITLQLDNGNIETISESGERKITSPTGGLLASQQGNTLEYKGNKAQEKLVYNTLNIPFGKQFELLLSDGTQVTLNSGSSLRYPVNFIAGKDRKVYLKGEAFFDVAKDASHPFIVNADQINIRVLGTQFNLSFYPEDEDISTVLVEGSVALYKEGADMKKNTTTQLVPGQQAAFNKSKNEMSVNQVDTHNHTAWKDGYLLFKASPFYRIRSKLERHFNISIEDKTQLLHNQVYTATFRNETIEEILEAFKEDTPFQYKREGSKITILDNNNANLKKDAYEK